MLRYFIAFAISLICAVCSTKTTKKSLKLALMVASGMTFFLLAALRSNYVGIDTWKNYSPVFAGVAEGWGKFDMLSHLSQKYELGFSAIVILLSWIVKDPTILFIFGSGVITFFTFTAIYQQSKKPWLSIAIFFLAGAFLLSMNGMRVYMALALILYALKYMKDGQFWKYALFVLIAGLLHRSVLLFILLYPLYKIKVSPKALVIWMLASVPLSFVIFEIAAMFLSGTIYNNYFYDGGESLINPLYSMLIINILVWLIFLKNYRKNSNDAFYNFTLKIQTVATIICIFSFRLPLSFRLEQIIDFLQILTVPYNIFLLEKDYGKSRIYYSILAWIMLLYGIYFTRTFVLSDDNQVRNYSTVLEKSDGRY